MIWADFLSGVAVPVLGSVALVAAGVVLWFVNAHRQQLKEQLGQVQHELELAAVKAEREQERAETLGRQLATRDAELSISREKQTALEAMAERYHAAGRKEHVRRLETEAAEQALRDERNALHEQLARASAAMEKQRRAERRARRRKRDAARKATAKPAGRIWETPVEITAPTFLPLAVRQLPVVCVLNLKGGVGKTTIAANLAGYFNGIDKRTLVIDLDHQRSLSQMMFSTLDRERIAHLGRTVQHFLTGAVQDTPTLVNCAERVPGLDHCWLMSNTDVKAEDGSNHGLDDLETELLAEWQRCRPACPDVRFLFRSALHTESTRLHYDHVIFDCPPRLTTACVNALAASDLVLIPVQAEAIALRSVQHLLKRLAGLRQAGVLGEHVQLAVVANMVPERGLKPHSAESLLLAEAEKAATRFWGSPVLFLRTKIPHQHRYADATQRLDSGHPLKLAIEYPSVHGVFEDLAKELGGLVDEHVGVAGVPA